MKLTLSKILILTIFLSASSNIFANNNDDTSDYGQNNLPKNVNIQNNKLDIVSIEKEFSANGRFYTHSAQQLSPKSGYYRIAVIDADGKKTISNPFTVSDDFSRESFAFCCDEPDTETLTQNTFTVIDSMVEID